ncbi:hydrogen gas-evolving membrane-bound hydrogenase subunit E [Lachnoclostridium sp. Marseille-P6806]|uniref:hydrogen gas-evolving membrane-bound hydrogenase subunit E n=1 Tax=Lachnoclostridium sp. Marseille-P6806 TaxID=2364793 RepID=UPI001031FD70|nr:hydrogen gas-evolving membrane-bound hydrogenase subunit E [Lachnoclostridium sp. Marseille-P6806]
MNRKKISSLVLAASLAVILICGAASAVQMALGAPTYDGSGTDVTALYEHPESYDNSAADGVAAVMVNENMEKTAAKNVVYSVVFNYRGYDTLGESFILIGAIAGTMAILRREKRAPKQVVDYAGRGFGETAAQAKTDPPVVSAGAAPEGGRYRRRPLIMRCGCDFLLPLAAVYGWYIVLHGAISPGGGFQGGVLAAGTVLLVYLAYGLTGVRRVFHGGFLHASETLAEILYVFIALMGIFEGVNFCFNFVLSGTEETAMLMNDAVGYHVMAGICCLLILMLEALNTDRAEEQQTE